MGLVSTVKWRFYAFILVSTKTIKTLWYWSRIMTIIMNHPLINAKSYWCYFQTSYLFLKSNCPIKTWENVANRSHLCSSPPFYVGLGSQSFWACWFFNFWSKKQPSSLRLLQHLKKMMLAVLLSLGLWWQHLALWSITLGLTRQHSENTWLELFLGRKVN